MADTIDHSTLHVLADAGGIEETHVKSTGTGWTVSVKSGRKMRQLMAQRGKTVRVFKHLETLTSYLKNAGIEKFDVDAAGFVAGATGTISRPDRAAALKRVHAAAEYDTWFNEQVQEAIDDKTPAIPQAEAKARFDRKKAVLMATMSTEQLAQLAAKRKAR